MNLMKKLTLMVVTILSMVTVLAIPPPNVPDDPFERYDTLSIADESNLPDYDISPSPLSLMGSSCTNLFKTSGSYCSGAIRIYYQCLKTIDGGEWQQRSENCGDYPGGGRCSEISGAAECVDYTGQTTYGKTLLFIGIWLFVLAIGAFFIPMVGPYLSGVLVIIGIVTLIKFIMGGV